ncbi:MAG: class I SAM-dependent methyltransferase [bacterium]
MSEARAERSIGPDDERWRGRAGPDDPAGRRLSVAEEWVSLLREIVRDAAALLSRGVRRSRSQVTDDYEHGVWRHALVQKPWLGAASLADYVEPARDRRLRKTLLATVNGRVVRIDTRDYYRYRNRLLLAVLERWAEGEEDLVELGCGAGVNLFALRLSGRWKRLLGFDVSENALTVARETARHFGVTGVAFETLDLGVATDAGFSRLRGKVVFTYYVLEQLKYELRPVIENLVRSGVRRAIHIETGTDLLHRWSLRFAANRLYILRQDYQDRLVEILHALEREGLLRIMDLRRLGHAPSPKNDPVMVVWEAR